MDKDKLKVYEFLQSHPIGVLATVDSDQNPHATTIYTVVEEDLTVKFLSKRDTQKIQNLKKNKHAVLVFFDAATQTNLQVIGTVEDITDEPKSNEVFTKVLEITRSTSQGEVPPISRILAGNYVAYKINPTQIRYANYQLQPSPSSEAEFITLNF